MTTGLAGFVLLTELMPMEEKRFVGLVLPSVYAVGVVVFSLLAYMMADWRYLTIATSVPALLSLLYMR